MFRGSGEMNIEKEDVLTIIFAGREEYRVRLYLNRGALVGLHPRRATASTDAMLALITTTTEPPLGVGAIVGSPES